MLVGLPKNMLLPSFRTEASMRVFTRRKDGSSMFLGKPTNIYQCPEYYHPFARKLPCASSRGVQADRSIATITIKMKITLARAGVITLSDGPVKVVSIT